jgi:hypothetical protein
LDEVTQMIAFPRNGQRMQDQFRSWLSNIGLNGAAQSYPPAINRIPFTIDNQLAILVLSF